MVLFGGQSSEHQISCASAAGVLEAIDTDRWHVVPVGITPEGRWVPEGTDPSRYRLGDSSGYTVTHRGCEVALLPGAAPESRGRLIEYQVDESGNPLPGTATLGPEIDVVFPVLHGPYGEDGTVQGALELAGVRYVGCGVEASAAAMDKRLTKAILERAGLPVGQWVGISPRSWPAERETVLAEVANLGLPAFVKPCRAGSSRGITQVQDRAELPAAIDKAASHDPQIIVEAAQNGREIECGVLELSSGELVISELGEIAVQGADFYDYETKYFGEGRAQLTCPAELPPDVTAQLQDAAREAFLALGAEGLARVDFFFDEDTGTFTVNEVNTMPGFTPFSMYPVMLAAAGYPYPELVETLLQQALSRKEGLR